MNILTPNTIVRNILLYRKSGIVLDLGVGPGRNAIFLAASGFSVIGVDKDTMAIDRFKHNASESGVSVSAELADILNFEIRDNYDVIVSTSVLHFIADPEKVIERMKFHTNIMGLNAVSAFTEDNPDKRFTHLFKKEELLHYYDEWEILEYREYLTDWEQHDGLEPHRHSVAEIIARNNQTP
jgi:2-polyprenyl-3-methyl-5-hydroxy-6-metoxy-1,4-benzoquinol methylase